MSRLENKQLMILVMVLLMIFSSLFAGIFQLNEKANNIQQEFLVGEKEDGLSIQRDLDTRISCARNIVTLAKKYNLDTDEAEKSILALSNADTISDKYQCNEQMDDAVQALVQQLNDQSLSQTNAKSLKEQVSIFNNAQNTISLDPYNTLVAEYEKETSGVIAGVMKIFAKDVEYFR